MTTYYADSFTRANSTTVPGTPDTGGPYTAQVGTWGINANQLYQPVSTSSAVLTVPIASADFDATFQFSGSPGGNSVGFLFRYSNATTFMLVYVSNGTLFIQRRVSGTGTVLATLGSTVVTDNYRVVAKGTRIQIFLNSVLVFQCDDDFNLTQAVVGWWISTTTSARIDNALVQSAPADLTYGVDGMTANTPDDDSVLTALDFPLPDAFAYLGHGSKTADTGGS